MKFERIIIRIFLMVLLFTFSVLLFACSDNNAGIAIPQESPKESAVAPSLTIRSRQKYEPSYDRNKTFLDYLETAEAKEKTEEQRREEIPVYYENELLFNNNMIKLTKDCSGLQFLSTEPTRTARIMVNFPTDARRRGEDGAAYSIYDTETGYRVYLFFTKQNDYTARIGYAVALKELHSYDDFSGIKCGDPVDEVEKIDSVVSLTKKYMSEYTKSVAENDNTYASVHYLKDGILRILYRGSEDGVYRVSDIAYYNDYVMPDSLGDDVNYKIKEDDLPG